MKLFDRISRRTRRFILSAQTGLNYFPWRTATRIFSMQGLGIFAILISTGYTLRHFAIEQFLVGSVIDSSAFTRNLEQFDEKFSWLLAVVLVVGLVWTSFVTYLGLRPMGRILRTVKRRGPIQSSDDDVYNDEPGEWQDLGRTVGKLTRGIRRREAQLVREREELVTILGSVNEAIVAMGRNTEPLFFNSRFAVLFGTGSPSAEPSLRERFRVPELLEGFDRVLTEGSTRTFRVRLRTSIHDSDREFTVSVSPLRSIGGGQESHVYGAVAVFHDITELKALEQIRIDFVANASHELKTPLTSVKGYVDTVRDDLKSGNFDEATAFLDVVQRNVDRLILLVNDLLDLSVLESGAEVKKSLLSTAEVSYQALNLIDEHQSKRHVIHIELRANHVFGDRHRIEQVIVNLVDNATKYSPAGSEIKIIWEPGAGVNVGETVLRVKDNGPGISEEHLPRLFERFYRVDAGRAREIGGTGLGLAIVKHIVIGHGGSIAVRSRIGEGSEFICRFPSVKI